MSDVISIGMSGAQARSEQLDAISDALANAQTPGYRAQRPAFAAVLSGAANASYRKPAIQGSGLLRVQRPNGELAYTRGDLIDSCITVPPDATKLVVIQSDGTLTATTPGNEVIQSADQMPRKLRSLR